jgi:hypothetical protein
VHRDNPVSQAPDFAFFSEMVEAGVAELTTLQAVSLQEALA